MTQGAEVVSPSASIQKAAKKMKEANIGAIPVCEGKLQGMVTDRDIVINAVSEGSNPAETAVSEVMSKGAEWIHEDEAVEKACQKMEQKQIRRLPVINHQKELVGMLALADIATEAKGEKAAETLEEISEDKEKGQSGGSCGCH
ncbi:MAG: CBS domain-containing protein [Candidatus Omnitrophica bacterium]|nr:CBS domain-containing protein [Candidatus Omnitrophota bacterium]MCF7898130.1 CBS domain-containing protein [Candidatus Omnitrophota bacterium]